ncbi:MAG: TIGR01440 family protein [Candidatus Coproplasma sp.]
MNEIVEQSYKVVSELIDTARLKSGSILIVGCSTSEVCGSRIGTNSNEDVAALLYEGISSALKEKGIYLAVQCCEHLNRAVVVERAAVPNAEYVNVVPQKKAGGSLATKAYHSFSDPVVVESIKADAGIDIGGTLIGMHLKQVAVPVRLSVGKIGQANIICARTRPKFIGGERAVYDSNLL